MERRRVFDQHREKRLDFSDSIRDQVDDPVMT
jgi:hypothetical protein